MTDTYFRKGFGLKREVLGSLQRDYHSELVERIRASGGRLDVGDLQFHLAKEFGFCYGVDRAVDYAYQSRVNFPDRRIFLVGEIIHNPHVNEKLRAMGVTFLYRPDGGSFDFSPITSEDVVILPAFGAMHRDFECLRDLGCIVVDTTCGSVLNVWKRVESYARDGFTALIHGKYYHEETKATSSQATKHVGGHYIIVRDMQETELVCSFIEQGGDAEAILLQFASAVSQGFDPQRHLGRIGVANQTTMLSSESLAIADRVRQTMERRFGKASLADHFRSFDTICSATQERQDAVIDLIGQPLDVMVVIGGYNSSNTTHLATICSQSVLTFHIEDALCIDPAAQTIRHQPVGRREETLAANWLPFGSTRVGMTAGASTPNNKIGEAVERICQTRGTALPPNRA